MESARPLVLDSLRSGALLSFAVIVACEADPAPLEWQIELPESVRTTTAVVSAEIRRESCAGEVRYSASLRKGANPAPPPTLGRGTFCFAARGLSDDCVPTTLRSTATVELPGAADLLVLLRLAEATGVGTSACETAEICNHGECSDPARDAGSD